MKSNYKIRNKKLITNFLLIIGIIFSTCFLSIGYAKIGSMKLDIDVIAFAGMQDGVFIADVIYDSNIDAEQEKSNINNYVQSTLNSTIALSESNPNSSITYVISVYNNSDTNYFYTGTSYMEKYYDNLGITYEVEGIEKWDVVQARKYREFQITFKYLNSALADSNILNSYIEFLFEPTQNRVIAELIYNGETTKQLVSLDDGTTTFEVPGIQGTVIRCNNSAIPTISNETILISGIITNTTCEIFDTLEESIETSDTTINNMLMIADEEVNFEDTDTIKIEANKKINLDLNGMTITASTINKDVNYIDNYGKFTIKDSKENGNMNSNYRVIGNLENGELNIEAGTYERTEGDVYCGGTITNFGGTVILENCTVNATSTAAFLNWGTEESVSLIDNCTLYTETGDTIINGSLDSEISISNSTITSSSGAAFKGAYLLSGGSDEECGPIYICSSELSGIFDYYVPGLGRFYYATNVTFMNGGNTPYSNNSDSLIKNYTETTDNEWYKVKCKTTSGEGTAQYSDGKNIRVGDKVKISTLLSSNYVLDVTGGEFVNNQNIQLYGKDSVAAQEFTFLASALDGYYAIAVYSVPTMCLNINGYIQSGANVNLYTYEDDAYERFELISYNSTKGNYNINSVNDVYLDIEGKQAANSQNIAIYTPDGTDSQKWQIERAE